MNDGYYSTSSLRAQDAIVKYQVLEISVFIIAFGSLLWGVCYVPKRGKVRNGELKENLMTDGKTAVVGNNQAALTAAADGASTRFNDKTLTVSNDEAVMV